uniref:Uncharacterized protein n=1 Tax=Candidatus Kentrum sp. TUN TaxID=2126343 RepID=A0A450ZL19_9GAMM|nr:MAG: hypothetical protein BECKTUN1418D_GA0071000_102319 [Candidatus Kentron sp. TUN]
MSALRAETKRGWPCSTHEFPQNFCFSDTFKKGREIRLHEMTGGRIGRSGTQSIILPTISFLFDRDRDTPFKRS